MTRVTEWRAHWPSASWRRWRKPVLLGLLALNLVIIARMLSWPDWRGSVDWQLWTQVPGFGSGISPFTPVAGNGMASPFRYSPVAIWVIQPIAVATGAVGFALLQFASLLALPRTIGLIVAVSFPFWFDVLWGNPFTFVFVAAFLALRGNRVAIIGFIVLTLLMPRPIQVPLLVWLLWREPWVRLPFAGIFLAHAGLVLWSGYTVDWVRSLMDASGFEATQAYNFGPTRFVGYAWFVVGVPLAVYLFRRHPGWAGLAISPYVFGQYWLMVLVDPQMASDDNADRPAQTRPETQ
jgi:hypothetical protein